jgi:hypothetical protein
MTTGPSDKAVADEESEHAAADAVRWETELAEAFAVLLGRPLDEFDPGAEYVLYHWDDIMSSEFLDEFHEPAQLTSVVRADPDDLDDSDGLEFAWTRWNLDLGRSVFCLNGDCEQSRLTGAQLAGVLEREEIDPAEEPLHVLARVETDGTLFGAMRAATWTMGPRTGPFARLGKGVQVEEAWEKALERVGPPELRNHLRMLCLTDQSARCDGAFYSAARHCPSDLRPIAELPGHRLIAAWEFGEGQASSAVFQVTAGADRAPGTAGESGTAAPAGAVGAP